MSGICVTGTDTGVGKTVVASALIRGLSSTGRVAGFKPVASGAIEMDGQLKNDDALMLIEAMAQAVDYSMINPYCFEPAIAPHIAAEEAGMLVDLDTLVAAYQSLASSFETVVLEGAGGWDVPLSNNQGFPSLIKRLSLPVVLVVGMKLGCINHSVLSQRAISQDGLRLVGWVANRIDPDMQRYDENLATLKRLMDCPCLGEIPDLDQAALSHAERWLDLDTLSAQI